MKCTAKINTEWNGVDFTGANCNGEMIEVGGIGVIDTSGNPNSYEQTLYQCEVCKTLKLV